MTASSVYAWPCRKTTVPFAWIFVLGEKVRSQRSSVFAGTSLKIGRFFIVIRLMRPVY